MRDGRRYAADDAQASGAMTRHIEIGLENKIEETVEVTFVPAPAPMADEGGRKRVLEVSSDDEEEVEPIVNDTVDLGAIATEFLLLGIDPYPRKPESVFQAPPVEDHAEHPFAALGSLRKGRP